MPDHSRRNFIFGAAGAVLVAGGAGAWELHQHLPARDPASEEHYKQAQQRLLDENGGRIRQRFIEITHPGMRVQVLEGGEGSPVLFIHGGDGTAAQWEPLLSRFSNSAHVYAPDRPGCGLTTMFDYRDVPLRDHAVQFVASVMDALQLPSATLVGNSMGGYFSLVFALAYPERVQRLITVGEPGGQFRRHPTLTTAARNAWHKRPDVFHRDEAERQGHSGSFSPHPGRTPGTHPAGIP